jgi:hypothetical protein
MAKLELPIRAFLEDYARRAFPNLDWSRGSAINDLVLKPMAVLLQPLRHDIDAVKNAQSVINYATMPRADLDALAANWGKFRQTGARSRGVVRLYFDSAADYQLDYLEFTALDGSLFVLDAPVKVTAVELMKTRRGDGSFTYDVNVSSIGLGSRYAVPAGSISAVRNGPPAIIRCENMLDFTTTIPDESNLDVVNSMYRNLGLRNMVTPQSIRAPLYDAFPQISDIFVAGPGHSKMTRDLVTVATLSGSTTFHTGGCADIWVNTSSLSIKEATFSYLPSSQKLRLVSAEQAAEQEILYSFSTAWASVDGLYLTPAGFTLDESSTIVFDRLGLASPTFPTDLTMPPRVARRDLISSDELFWLPSPTTRRNPLVTDMTGIDISGAVQAHDSLLLQNDAYRLSAAAGRVMEVLPAESSLLSRTVRTYTAGLSPRSSLVIPVPNVTTGSPTVDAGSRLLVLTGPAAGEYTVQAVNGGTNQVRIGTTLAACEVSLATNAVLDLNGDSVPETAVTELTLRAPGGAAVAQVPVITDDACHIVVGALNSPTTTYRIHSVDRAGSDLVITVYGTFVDGLVPVSVVQGLLGDLLPNTTLHFYHDTVPNITTQHKLPWADQRTRYTNVTTALLAVGATTVSLLGIGRETKTGDMLVIDDALLEFRQYHTVAAILSDGSIRIAPAIQVEIEPGARLAVLACNTTDGRLGTVTVASLNGTSKDIGVTGLPLGAGDALGFQLDVTGPLVPNAAGAPVAVTATLVSVSGTVTSPIWTATFSGAPDLTRLQVGDTISFAGTTNVGLDGNAFEVTAVNAVGYQVSFRAKLASGTVTGGTVSFTCRRFYTIEQSSGGLIRRLQMKPPTTVRLLSLSSVGYSIPPAVAIGSPVTQTVGATTYRGVLVAIDNVNFVWTVQPNTGADTFAVTADPVTLPVYGTSNTITAVSATTTFGYVAPLVGQNGALVKQGVYRGQFDFAASDLPNYIWAIKPLTADDVFDRIDTPTLIDTDDNGVPDATGYGTARDRATEPIINLGATTLTVDQFPCFTMASTVYLRTRQAPVGALLEPTGLTVDRQVNSSGIFTTNSVGAGDRVVLPLGDNTGSFTPSGNATSFAVPFPSGTLAEEAALPLNSPYPLSIVTPAISAGITTLSLSGSSIGMYGHSGRIVKLVRNGVSYYCPIAAPLGADSVQLTVGLPVGFLAGTTITVSVLDGFLAPFFVLPAAGLQTFRTARPAVLHEALPVSGVGSQSAGDTFSTDISLSSTLQFTDFDAGDVQLFLSSGPSAQPDPYPIVSMIGGTTLVVAPASFESAAVGVSFTLAHTRAAAADEQWFTGTVTSATTIAPDAPLMQSERYGSLDYWRLDVYPLTDTWSAVGLPISGLTASLLTLDITRCRTQAPAVTDGVGFGAGYYTDSAPAAPAVGTRVRFCLRATQRTMTLTTPGYAAQSFSYYSGGFMTLPVARVISVQELESETGAPSRDLPWTLLLDEPGLRYSSKEVNTLQINDTDAIRRPIRVRYVADTSIATIDSFVNTPDNRVVNASQVVKRMESLVVNVSMKVRTTLSAEEISLNVASFINQRPSTQPLSKDAIIAHLYSTNAVSQIETETFTLTAIYYGADGSTVNLTSDSVYGSETACYLSGDVLVTVI